MLRLGRSRLVSSELYIDPVGAYIRHGDTTYYRDGVLYGTVLPDAEVVAERSMPTLWSSVVVNYRKKPVEVQAIQLLPDNADEIAEWCGGSVVEEIDPIDDTKRYVGVNIPTLEGVMRASENDYVIKGVKGEFYPCKPEIFAATYEIC